MRILLIWEEVPEETRLYLFDTGDTFGAIPDDHVKVIMDAHGSYVNQDSPNEEAAIKLNDLLGQYKDKILDEDKPPKILFSSNILSLVVVRAGFIC